MVKQNTFTIKIGGQAGQGIKSAGLILAKLASRSGYHVCDYIEYASLIRGGHNAMQIVISSQETSAPTAKTDLLVALNQETINLHAAELTTESGLIYDNENGVDISQIKAGISLYPMPLMRLAKVCGGSELLQNTVALGAVAALLGGDRKILGDLITEEFGKQPEILQMNLQALEVGFNFAIGHFAQKLLKVLTPRAITTPSLLLSGNDAVCLGAVASDLRFAAIYPMSPISKILHTLASWQEKYDIVVKQPEDEIAGINMAIGAAFTGARSMVATSGGGFCLMTEGVGLAGMTEMPLVIALGARPGPATGLPTWSEQGDLQFVLHAAAGDFPRIVLAPGDAKETVFLTKQAFDLADKYQTPVIVLMDANLCENDQSFPLFNIPLDQLNRGKLISSKLANYQRFAIETDGISPRAIPGSGNFFIANSDEHTSIGFTSEAKEERIIQMQKRMNKLITCEKQDLPEPMLYGPKKAALTIVSWGSNKGTILQAMREFDNVNFLHLTWLNPFPVSSVRNILAEANYILDIECNYTGQLAALIREKVGIEIMDKMLKYDGRPFFVEEISDKIKSIVKWVD